MATDTNWIERLRAFPGLVHADALDWCRGRSWLVRAPLLAYCVYIGLRMLWDPQYWTLLHSLNLPIHEAGHPLFSWFGPFLCAAGGTILQFAAPLGSMIMFFRQRDYFAICFCFAWLATNCYHTGVYMADATELVLPLVTIGGGDAQHDWLFLFGKLRVLRQAKLIGWLTCQAGLLCMLACWTGSVYLFWRMHQASGRNARTGSGAKI
ncbi:MAG: hypothetical protein HS116_11285 [Planctomycetes bacterium]|nr:hypothetical protein [Planctomycetota bacterium]